MGDRGTRNQAVIGMECQESSYPMMVHPRAAARDALQICRCALCPCPCSALDSRLSACTLSDSRALSELGPNAIGTVARASYQLEPKGPDQWNEMGVRPAETVNTYADADGHYLSKNLARQHILGAFALAPGGQHLKCLAVI
ncbi:hypothetical protein THAOC_09179, partial [Thalassiosira oceanica]